MYIRISISGSIYVVMWIYGYMGICGDSLEIWGFVGYDVGNLLNTYGDIHAHVGI